MRRVGPYVLTLAGVAALTAVKTSYAPIGALLPFMLYVVLVLAATWVGGRGPGVVATVACAVSANYFFLGRPRVIELGEVELVQSLAFALECAVVVVLVEWIRIARSRSQSEGARVAALQRLTRALAGARTAAEVADVAVVQGIEALSATAGVMVRVDGRGDLGPCAPTDDAALAESARGAFERQRTEHTATTIAFPLALDGAALGALAFRVGHDAPFDKADRSLLGTVAEQASQSLARALGSEREVELRAHLELLQVAAAGLSRAATSAEVAAVIVDRGVAAMDADTCTLYLLDEAGARLELLGVEGVPELLVDRLRALDGQSHPATWAAFEAGETVWIETPAAYAARFDGLLPGASRTQAFWSAPLVVEGRRVGLLAMGYHRARRFAPSQRAFVATFTQQCAQALLRALRLDREVAARAAADEASRLKDEFLATVSHELRTPLNALVGWSQMLSSGRLVEEGARARACETIERNALSMTRLVEQLLDVSHAVSGKLRLSLVPVDLAALVEAAVDALRPAAAAKELAVHVSLEPSIEGLVGDPDRLQQVAWNLLCNAVRFTPPQGAVDVSLRRRGDVAELRVRDHGIGFDPSFAPHLFERFRQADGGTTRTHGGLGLGLAIVRQLVELHGGTVEAESEGLGRGAAFTVRLPIVAARAGVEEAPPSGSGVSSRFADPDERPTRAS